MKINMKYADKFLNYFLFVVIAVLIYTRLSSGRAISKYDPLAAAFTEKNPGRYCDGVVERVYDANGILPPYKCNGIVKYGVAPPPTSTMPPPYGMAPPPPYGAKPVEPMAPPYGTKPVQMPPPSPFKPAAPPGSTMSPPIMGMSEAQAAKLEYTKAVALNRMKRPLTPYQRYLISRGGNYYCPGPVEPLYGSAFSFKCSVAEKRM